MRRVPSPLLIALVGLVLLCAGVPAVAGAAADGALASADGGVTGTDAGVTAAETTTSDDSTATAAQTAPLVETAEYRLLPEQPDTVEVELRYEVPDGVEELSFAITGSSYRVVATDGFTETDDGWYEWSGAGDGGSVTIRHDVSESFRPEKPDEEFVGGNGEWAIVARPHTSTRWFPASEASGVEYELEVAGEGRAGERLAYLGPHETHQSEVAGERHTLVVPDAASLESSPAEILDSVDHASDRLRVGQRSAETVLFVAPEGPVDWSPPGLALGSDARIVEEARVDDRVDVWLHEYVHTRQHRDNLDPSSEAVADDVKWFIEGSADYYAALLGLEQGNLDFTTFRGVLERGTDPSVSDAVLADPATWEGSDANYEKGALVAATLDREIRRDSDGEHTLQAVLREWNRQDTFTAADLEAAAEEYGDASTREFVEQYTRTEATPEPWNQSVHREYFDADVAQFDYRVVSDPPVSVDGPYRTGSLPRPLVTGETITSEVRVENVGDTAGGYRAVMSVGGERLDEATGRLDPGETTTVELEATLSRTGDHSLLVGDHSQQVAVREPAQPRVTEFTIETGTPVIGEPTPVTATVQNPANRPAHGDVELLVDGAVVDSETVSLASGESTEVELAATFETTGEHNVSMHGGHLTVEAREPTIVDRVPGFGAVAAVAALVAATALLARRD